MSDSSDPHAPSLLAHPCLRVAALFLLVYGVVHLLTLGAIALVSSSFTARSTLHVEREVARIRKQIATDEAELDAMAAHAARSIAATPNANRRQLFRFVTPPGDARNRGIRYVAPSGDIVA